MGNCLSGLRTPMLPLRPMDSHAASVPPVDSHVVPMEIQGGNDTAAALAQAVLPTHIFYGTGYVVHGLGMHFSNGVRTGLALEDSKASVNLHDGHRMPVRAGQTIPLQPGELPISIQGFASNMGFLAFQVSITSCMANGVRRRLPIISGTEQDQCGMSFHADAPPGHYFKDFWWQAGSLTSAFVAVIPDVVSGGNAGQADLGWIPLADLTPRQ